MRNYSTLVVPFKIKVKAVHFINLQRALIRPCLRKPAHRVSGIQRKAKATEITTLRRPEQLSTNYSVEAESHNATGVDSFSLSLSSIVTLGWSGLGKAVP